MESQWKQEEGKNSQREGSEQQASKSVCHSSWCSDALRESISCLDVTEEVDLHETVM